MASECSTFPELMSISTMDRLPEVAPRSPDLTPCDFFLWGFMKDAVYVPPLSTDLNDLRNLITATVNSVMQDIRHQDWDEFNYRLHVICAAVSYHVCIIKCYLQN